MVARENYKSLPRLPALGLTNHSISKPSLNLSWIDLQTKHSFEVKDHDLSFVEELEW